MYVYRFRKANRNERRSAVILRQSQNSPRTSKIGGRNEVFFFSFFFFASKSPLSGQQIEIPIIGMASHLAHDKHDIEMIKDTSGLVIHWFFLSTAQYIFTKNRYAEQQKTSIISNNFPLPSMQSKALNEFPPGAAE
jgi:hypothetical protein